MERRVLAPISGVHWSLRVEERADAGERVVAGGPVERRALLAVRRARIELALGRLEQLLQQSERVLCLRGAARVLHRQVHDRRLGLVVNHQVGTEIDEAHRGGDLPARHRLMQWRLHHEVDRVELGALVDGELQQVGRGAVRGEPMQRRRVVLVARAQRR